MGIGIAALLWMPIVMHTLQRTLDLSAMEFLRALGVPFVAATAMAIFVYAAGTRLPASLGTGVERLILLVLIGAAIYAASILLFARSHVNDLRLIMGKLIGKRSA